MGIDIVGGLGFLLVVLAVLSAILTVLFNFVAPAVAIGAALLLPLISVIFLGGGSGFMLTLLIYEVLVLAVLYAIRKRKSNEIRKW